LTQTLIIEPDGYSSRAIFEYEKMGPVFQGEIENSLKSEISLLVVRLAHIIDKDFLVQFPSLIAIATPTTGLTHIDTSYCVKRNIKVFSLRDCKENITRITSTSELTFGLIINLLRMITPAHNNVCAKSDWNRYQYQSRQLSTLTLGLIGFGRIGRHVASYANAFGMHVMAFDPFIDQEVFIEANVKSVDLNTLLKKSDIVSMHASWNSNSECIIGKTELSLMKHSALLINTARGALIDESEAVSALKKGKLTGIAVDVLEDEHSAKSLSESDIVLAAKEGLNVIVTPHIGGCTVDAMHITEEVLAKFVVSQLSEWDG
tara:strand:- start:118053 stop:119006 length:954 start_codon:yes stop_codon:yes gene_type:complete